MQLTEALQRSGTVHGPIIPTIDPVLPLPFIQKSITDKKFLSRIGHATVPPAAPHQDSIQAAPTTLTVPMETQSMCGPAPAAKSLPVTPPKIVRPRSASVSRRLSKNSPFIEQDIPLYLVPAIIARAIWQRGELTFRISVIRTKQHYYTIRLRTARPGSGAGNKSCGKSRCGMKTKGCPGKIQSPHPTSQPVEMQNP